MDFGKHQDRFGCFSKSKSQSSYLVVKLKVFNNIGIKDSLLVQKPEMGQAVFNQFMRLKNQLALAARNFGREENLSPVLIPTMSKDMDEQSKQAHKVIEIVGRINRKIVFVLLRYNVDKPERS